MKATVGTLYLSKNEVQTALPMNEAIESMREAFRLLSETDVQLPTRHHIHTQDHDGVALIMPCYAASLNRFSLKSATVFHKNHSIDLPAVQATVMLIDGFNGSTLAIMEGGTVTAIRTGAASGLATDLLANPDAETVAIIGAGVQARTQLEAVCHVRKIKCARIYSRSFDSSNRFKQEMSQTLDIMIEVVDTPSKAIADAAIICTATSSTTPVFDDRDVSDGTHINATGSYRPDMAEIPAETIARSRVIVDHLPSASSEAGDLLIPLQQGLFKKEHFSLELGKVVSDPSLGRSNPGEITVFKSVGVAIQDLCAANHAFNNAIKLGIGKVL